MPNEKIRTGIIGCGGMSLHHIKTMFQNDQTEIAALCDPSKKAIRKARKVFKAAGLKTPPNEPKLTKFLESFDLDAVLIATPHSMHHDQTIAALESGLDVLLEKPMAMKPKSLALSII